MTDYFTWARLSASVAAMAALNLAVPAATAQSGSANIRLKPISATAKPTALGCNINSSGGDPAMTLLADSGKKNLGVFDRAFKDMKGPIPVTLQFSSGANQFFRMSPTNTGGAKITLSSTAHETLLTNIAASNSVTIINGTTKLTVPLVEAASAVSTYRSCTAMLPKPTPPPPTIAQSPSRTYNKVLTFGQQTAPARTAPPPVRPQPAPQSGRGWQAFSDRMKRATARTVGDCAKAGGSVSTIGSVKWCD